jgi:factor associated with neutral sphingomyelinase activation
MPRGQPKLGSNLTKSRFNLLLLEEGEFYLEDYSIFQYPHPTSSGKGFEECKALKVQGRLKLCTRSLMFEPADTRLPIECFPFKAMAKILPHMQGSGDFFEFECTDFTLMKENNQIA